MATGAICDFTASLFHVNSNSLRIYPKRRKTADENLISQMKMDSQLFLLVSRNSKKHSVTTLCSDLPSYNQKLMISLSKHFQFVILHVNINRFISWEVQEKHFRQQSKELDCVFNKSAITFFSRYLFLSIHLAHLTSAFLNSLQDLTDKVKGRGQGGNQPHSLIQ